MAHLPVIAHTFRCALNWTESGGQTAANVIHIFDQSGTATAANIATALDNAAAGGMWACVVPTASVTDIGITPLDGTTATQHFTPATPSHWVGQNGTQFVPQVAVIVKLSTGLRGREHRGRVFLPFVAESSINDGFLDSTQATAMTSDWNDFQDDLNTSTPNALLVVASYKLATQDTVIEPLTVETVLATQRRRQGRLRGA